jgi:hypothetical protein
MQSPNTILVLTAEQSISLIADQMIKMRMWLDNRRSHLAGFASVPISAGKVAFEAYFIDSGHADLFRAAFG